MGCCLVLLVSVQGCDVGSTAPDASTDGDYRIPAVSWPTTFEDLGAIMDAVPRQIGGMLMVEPTDGDLKEGEGFDLIELRYRGADETVSLRMANLREPGMPPRLALVNFFFSRGEGNRCADGTYLGSLEVTEDPEGDYPGFKEEQLPQEGLPWFSCQRQEGGSQPSSYVAGWFNGEVVWFVNGSSRAAVQQFIDELARGMSREA